MKTATVRDLRNNFGKLEAWLAEGEEIEIRRQGTPVAVLSKTKTKRTKKFVMPDFEARRKAIWGDRMFTQEEVDRMRDFEREGEEG